MFISSFAGYIEKLINKTVELCEENKEYIAAEVIPELLCSAYEYPSKTTAIQEHTSRFSTTNSTKLLTTLLHVSCTLLRYHY